MKRSYILGCLLLESVIVLAQTPPQENSTPKEATTYVHVQSDKYEEDVKDPLVTVTNKLNDLLRMDGVAVSGIETTQGPLPLSELLARRTQLNADYVLLLTVTLSGLRGFPKSVGFRSQAYDRSGNLIWDDGVTESCGAFWPGKKCLDDAVSRSLSQLLARYATSLKTNPPGEFYQMYPVIRGFTPPHAPVGAQIVITGAGFVGATSVAFGGVNATGYTVDSGFQITATVPTGAQSGKISVTSKRMGVTSSKGTFTVTP